VNVIFAVKIFALKKGLRGKEEGRKGQFAILKKCDREMSGGGNRISGRYIAQNMLDVHITSK